MLKVRTGDLPSGWSGLSLTEKRDLIAEAFGIPFEGSAELVIGGLKGVLWSRSSIRHSIKEYWSPEKDALLMSPAAFKRVLKNARFEKEEVCPKDYVARAYRYKGDCLLDGARRAVGLLIHLNSKDNRFRLYHVSVYDI